MDEGSPLAPLGDQPVDKLAPDYANYGALKALCEEEVRRALGERATVVRPGLIVGAHDPTGRFTYWPHRIARGGEVLAPGPPGRRVQFLDVRDLGDWLVELGERDVAGTFNASHPGIRWSELLDACRSVSGSDAEITWVPDEFLLEHEVGEWMELPLWIADRTPAETIEADVRRALAAGLHFRPLEDTVHAALDQATPTEVAGLDPDREATLLAAWHAR
jgi:2'-hydroxyisoflavone reductase